MQINGINTLAAQRAAFEAAPDDRTARYQSLVLEPLRPFWEPMLGFMPPGSPTPPGDPIERAADLLALYGPQQDADAALHALATPEEADSWAACKAALHLAHERLRPAEHGIALPEVAFSLGLMNPHSPGGSNPHNQHYTGFGAWPGKVMVLVWPTAFNIPRLPSATAHEFNHNVRLSYEPFTPQTSVGQYIVLEGLAECFAAELFGEELVGPWARMLSAADLDALRPRFRADLEVTGFNDIRGYLFGDWGAASFGYNPKGLPDFAGYTIGYEVVRAYLARTNQTASAATYVPWRAIVEGSGYL